MATAIALDMSLPKNHPPPIFDCKACFRSEESTSRDNKVLVFPKTTSIDETPKQTAISASENFDEELKYIINNCLVANWDNEGAASISEKSIKYAIDFIGLLPNTISLPELVPEPSGELAMVWWKNGFHLALGIDNDSNAAYGATTPSKGKIFGDFKFKYEIPLELIQLLEKIESV
ncbi:MAG: hypothetical protein ABIE74_07430 [Pseudomonadota bacterium]